MPDTNDVKTRLQKIIDEVSSSTTRLLAEKMASLQKVFDEEIAKSSHVVSVPSEKHDLTDLKAASYALKNAQGQADIISAILMFAGKCVQRSAVFAFKSKKFYGWQAIGLKADNPSAIVSIKNIVVDGATPSPFLDVVTHSKPWVGKAGQNAVLEKLYEALGGPVPKEICLFPLMIKDRLIAVLYGDNITGSQVMFQTDAIEVLSIVASLIMEVVSLQRTKGPGATDQLQPEKATDIPTQQPTKPVAPPPEDMDEATRKIHEKAKRTARVIVGDIALYNKAKITQGQQTGKLGDLLREDITKGRDLYHQRVAPEITRATNYYEEALIDLIAKGDRKILGL